MITEHAILTILACFMNLVVIFWIASSLMMQKEGLFGFLFFRLSLYGFAFSTIVAVVFRIQRLAYGDDALALLPYWFLRDVATFILAMAVLMYYTVRRKIEI